MATATGGSAALAGALTIGIKVAGSGTCDAAAYAAASSAAYPAVGGTGRGGDRRASRSASGASEWLCFRVELPASADNSLPGLTANATFTFAADPS